MTMQAQLCQWHLGLDVVVEDSNVQMDNLDVVAAGSSMQVNHPGLDVVAAGSGGQQQLQEHTVIDEQPRNVVDELGAGSNQYTGKYLPAWLHVTDSEKPLSEKQNVCEIAFNMITNINASGRCWPNFVGILTSKRQSRAREIENRNNPTQRPCTLFRASVQSRSEGDSQ
eukprot:g64423.t1